MHQSPTMLLEKMPKEEKCCQFHDKITFINKSDPIHQCFHVQLLYQGIRRDN